MTIPYIRKFDFDYGHAERISPNVRRLVANNPGPFTGWGTNVYLIGSSDLILVDPGPDTDPHFEILLAAIGTASVSAVFVTHHHMDHSPMAPRLAAHFGCKTFGFGPTTQTDAGDHSLEAGTDAGFCPDIRIKDQQVIAGDGWQMICVHTPGHTSNHVCYALQPDNGLICGDHVLAWSTSVIIPPDGKMDDYLHSLRKVRAMDFRQLWPGHGPAIDQPKPFLSAYLDHRAKRDQQIISQLKSGTSQIKQMVPMIYPDLDRRLAPAAAVSVLSHLILMVKTGLVRCSGPPGIDANWQLV